ncbi:beta-lactamase family protein [Ancylobacter sp. 6x-1]|uniref:Beta-lactamase family protein n=1 Tax=Ancylobacter crimeensis TaxID=2579147 RepID=A0ABT0D836_9HYPH|nr:serine hydrolase [Ancylobacter crimeensis]MCK0196084.1 beta-lactamase family protein [Ancylobacter crimeensis]
MDRRLFLAAAGALIARPSVARASRHQRFPDDLDIRREGRLDDASALEPLRTVIVAREGAILAERAYRGASTARPTNIKSASKVIVTALAGIAIERGLLTGVDQPIAPLLAADLPPPDRRDPRLARIALGDLLSMQAGLDRLSGPNYGRWVSSRNWVRSALAQPFAAEPGGDMLYSTASTHLVSAILTRVSGRSTLELARAWLGPVPGFSIASWSRDPQGIYLGGNEMAMTPRSLLAFGELFRACGRTPDGRQVVPESWVEACWTPRTASRFTGDAYGYGWFLRTLAGREVRYGWGYGGQMLYVVPEAKMTIVMTSATDQPSARTGYRDELHALAADLIEG